MTGTVLAQLALTVLVYVRTRSPLLASLTFTVTVLPHLIAGTLLSAVVDRVPIRRLLVGCNVLSAAVALLLAVPGMSVAALLLLALVLGLIQPVFVGARSATLPEVLPGPAYVPGRSLLRIVAQVAQVGGFAVSGLLLIVLSPSVLLVADAGSFAIAALLLRFGTRERRPATSTQGSLLRDSWTALGGVLAIRPLRRVLLLGWLVPFFAVMPEALAVPYAASLSAGSLGAGLLLTAIPLGTVVGEVVTNWRVPPRWQTRLVAVAAALTFVPLLGFVLRPAIPLAVAVLFVAGLGACCHLGLDRLVLDTAPASVRARTLSIQSAGLMFWQGVGFGVAGAAAELVPAATVIPVAGSLGLVAVAWYVISPRLAADPGSAPAKQSLSGNS